MATTTSTPRKRTSKSTQVQDIATKAVANCGKTVIATPTSPAVQSPANS